MHTVLIVDDQKLIRDSLKMALIEEGYDVFVAETGQEALTIYRKENIDLVLLDIRLPDINGIDVLKQVKAVNNNDVIVIMMTAYGTIDNAVQAMKLGAFDYITKPFKTKNIETIIKLALETNKLKREVTEFRDKTKTLFNKDKIIGKSQAIFSTLDMMKKISHVDTSTVLITGESGTGKELVAKAVHYNSARADGPFVEINCSAIPFTLLESELFGYEQGAFTDAKKAKKGLIELANGGSLFLDEVGDMDLGMQAKLLSVLQEKKVRRLGGSHTVQVNTRIIASTNHNLRDQVQRKEFREDLYYRLNVIHIYLPPLRERGEDIVILSKYFIDEFNRSYKRNVKGIDEDAIHYLMHYSWPGNVRELRNTIERIMIINDPETITSRHLPREILDEKSADSKNLLFSQGLDFEIPEGGLDIKEHTNSFQAMLIKKALLKAGGSKTKAAKLLNVDRFSLRYLINKIGIS